MKINVFFRRRNSDVLYASEADVTFELTYHRVKWMKNVEKTWASWKLEVQTNFIDTSV